jgi:hypothetical protein
MKRKTLTIVPSAVDQAIKPKPSRAEIIEAAVQLRLEELQKEAEVVAKHNQRLSDAVVALIPAAVDGVCKNGTLAKSLKDNETAYYYRDYAWADPTQKLFEDHLCVTIKIEKRDLTSKLRAALANERDNRKHPPYLSVDQIRREVKQGLKPSADPAGRVKALLADSDSRTALQSLLNAVYPKPEAVEV